MTEVTISFAGSSTMRDPTLLLVFFGLHTVYKELAARCYWSFYSVCISRVNLFLPLTAIVDSLFICLCAWHQLNPILITISPHQCRSEGQAWPGACLAKVCPAHVCVSASVVKCTASAWPIPMTWLRHWTTHKMRCMSHNVICCHGNVLYYGSTSYVSSKV